MSDKAAAKSNVFAGRNFRLVFFGALVSDLGAVLYSFAVSFYILEISGNNAFLQGLYLALCGVVLLISTPVGGVLGDRYNKARIMFICDYLKGGLILLATLGILCFPAHGAQLVILFIVGILGNAVSGIFSPPQPHCSPTLFRKSGCSKPIRILQQKVLFRAFWALCWRGCYTPLSRSRSSSCSLVSVIHCRAYPRCSSATGILLPPKS